MASREQQTRDISKQLNFLGLTQVDREALAALKPEIVAAIDPALDKFYEVASAYPETARHFSDKAHMDHAKAKQLDHWSIIADGTFDEQYTDSVARIGRVHANLGLEPKWYIGGYAVVLEQLISHLIEGQLKGFGMKKKAEKLSIDISAIVKAALMDMEQVISVYLEILAKERDEAAKESQRKSEQVQFAVDQMAKGLDTFAKGDLSFSLEEHFEGNLDGLRTSLNASVQSIATTLSDIAGSAESIRAKAFEMRSSASSLSQRTESQAAALEETAAALEEITTTVTQSSEGAKEARHIAQSAKTDTEESGKVVADAIDAMERIEGASSEISNIINVIDDIAFQTNLLALNAGVEAARAGEAGAGFAVVAQEVRELAQRCATAAKEIATLITKSNSEIVNGVTMVKAAGESLEKISSHVGGMNEKMVDISNAADQQLTGIREVNTAVGEMDQMTQKNAAMAEESSATSYDLTDELDALSQKIGRFKLSGTVSVQQAA